MPLTIEEIQERAKTSEDTVEIESWGGEVKIRTLTVAQGREVAALYNKGDRVGSVVRTVYYGLVEPKVTLKQLDKLASRAGMNGINEIAQAISELDSPKN